MAEIVEPGVLRPSLQRRKRVRWTDVVIFAVLVAVIIALLVTLLGKLNLKHEVSAAQPVAERVVKDISTQNASDARAVSDTKFQAKNSAAQLKSLFAAVDEAVKGTPVLDRQIVSNDSSGQNVYFIYKYAGQNGTSAKYIRVTITQAAGAHTWQLTGIKGDTDESALIVT